MQCQVVVRNALKSSLNSDINLLWSSSSVGCNIQYDQFRNTKQVLNAIQNDKKIEFTMNLNHKVSSPHPSFFMLAVELVVFGQRSREICLKTSSTSPSSNLITLSLLKKNLFKWSLSPTPEYSCLQSETLQHIASSCKSYCENGRYAWHHNSVLSYLAKSMSLIKNALLYVDLPSFSSPSLITGDSLMPDLVLVLNNATVYLLELTVGFETNIKINNDRKAAKYRPLLANLCIEYTNINFVNISISALGILVTSLNTFLQILNDLNFNQNFAHHIFMKASNVEIRCAYYIYCRRNKQWTSPDLLQS